MRIVVAMALSLLSAGSLQAQTLGQDLPDGFRSLMGVTLDQDSAASIIARFGPAPQRRTEAGHDAFDTWCFAVGASPSRTLVELMSDASDMGTPGRELTVISVRADAPAADLYGCAPLRIVTPLATPSGLRLGLTRAQVQRLLGRPTRVHVDSLVYDFHAKQPMLPGTSEYATWNTPEYRESCFDAGPPYANVTARVVVVLQDARAAELRIERFDQAVC